MKKLSLAVMAIAMAVGLMGAQPVQAALTWDANNTGAFQTDGGGTWLNPNQWWDGGANVTWTSGSDAAIGNGGAGGTITLGAVTAGSVTFTNFTGTYTLSSGSLDQSGGITISSGNVTINSTVSGAGGLSKAGSGILITTSTANNHTGKTLVSGGILQIGTGWGNSWASGTLPAGSNLELNGATVAVWYYSGRNLGAGSGEIQLTGGTCGFAMKQADAGGAGWTINNSAAYEVVWGIPTFNPSVLLLSDAAAGPTIYWRFVNRIDLNGTNRTLSVTSTSWYGAMEGVIRNTGATPAGIIKIGPGTLRLTAANTYDGDTTVNAGIVQFGSAGSIAGSTRNVIVASGAGVAGGYAINNAFLNRLQENANTIVVALGATSGNALDFSSSAGATLPNASLGATGAFTYSGALTPNGTTYRLGGGGGTLTVSSALNAVGNSLIVSGTLGGGVVLTSGGNTYAGSTTINDGGSLTLSGSGVINASTAITLTRGSLILTNVSTVEGSINRVKNDAPISFSYGGAITYNNTTGNTYAETIGTVTIASGQLNVAEAVNAGLGSQTLTLSGLSRPGSRNTSAVTFSAAGTPPAATVNMIKVTGATQTPAGQVIGPWATIGTAAAAQTDYAVYDAATFVVPATIAASGEGLWTTANNAYTLSGATALTGTRTITALRYSGAANALALGANNLETYGLLNGGSGLLTVSGTGALRTPTGGGNLYITTGSAAITVSAPVTDNGGAVTLVKSGSTGTLTLSGTISYSGDTVVNAGTLQLNTANANNDASSVFIAAAGATLNLGFAGTDSVNKLFIGSTRMPDGVYRAVGNIATGTDLAQLAGGGTLTVSDTIAPTLAPGDIVDDKSGGPIVTNTLVTYTVTFSEDMDSSTVDAADFGNAGTATISIGAVTETATDSGIFTVPVTATGAGTLQLQVNAAAVLNDYVGNNLDTTSAITDNTTITVDGTAPTLAGSDIADDRSGGPITPSTLVTYTVTFSEDMDTNTVSTADFSNAGTSTIIFGAITETGPGVFTVEVTPSDNGTLQLQVNAGAVLKDVAGNNLDTTSAIADDTTITVSGSDTTPPTLAGSDIVDDQGGGPIIANTLVTYTVTFSEDMDSNTVDNTDFGNAGTAGVSFGTVTETGPGVFAVQVTPTNTGSLQLQVNAGAILWDAASNALDTTSAIADNTTITVDGTPPTLAGSAIVDDKSGGPVNAGELVTYTVTFSEDMDSNTVSAADFGNAGTASITLGTVSETAPTSGVFTVPVRPTSAGSLQLQVNAGAVLKDVVGNALDTTSAIADDTTITVNLLTLTWDANNTGALQTDGAGAWLNANQWWNGSANQNWLDWNDAVFGNGGAGNAVTLASLATVHALTLNSFSGTYTLGSAGQTITLNAGITINLGAGATTIDSPIVLGGAQTWLNNSAGLLTANATLGNGGYMLTVSGGGNTTLPGLIIGGGGLTKSGNGTLIISNTGNAYFGPTVVTGGILQIGTGWGNSWASGTLPAGNLELNGGTVSVYYYSSRSLGAGANQIQITGGRSGFSTKQGDASQMWTVNGNANYEVVWGALGEGAATGYFNPTIFVLNDNAAPPALTYTFANKIDLNGANRTIECGSATWGGILPGVIRNSSGTPAGLIKTGPGTLQITAANTYDGDTTVSEGTLSLAGSSTLADGAALRIAAGAKVALAAGVNETVAYLYLDGAWVSPGTWGGSASTAEKVDDTHFTGSGILTVLYRPRVLDGGMILMVK